MANKLLLSLGVAAVLLPLQSAQSATFSTVFAFDLHYTLAGVVQGSGSHANYLFGTIYDSSLSYGGNIYRVPIDGGAPEVIYALQSSDGYTPKSTLLLGRDGYLYGTTHYGARVGTSTTAGSGTVFRLRQDGSGFTVLHRFADAQSLVNVYTGDSLNADGMYPDLPLIDDDDYLYGVTLRGGLHGAGVIYRIRKADGNLLVLHHFASPGSDGLNTTGEGAYPSAALTLGSDGRLYGVTSAGGANAKTSSGSTVGTGTLFSIGTDGSGFQPLYNFSELDDSAAISTNGDGVQPGGKLLEISPGVLIGTTMDGGTPEDGTASGYGTIFRFDVSSGTLTTLYAFDNTTGSVPIGNLVQDASSGLVYGEVTGGSSSSGLIYGALFSIEPLTATYSVVHPLTFSNGNSLTGSLLLASNGDLYGSTTYGGLCTSYAASGFGGVFRYSIGTGNSANTYASCTVASSSSGGGSMDFLLLSLLSLLGSAPTIRRRLLVCWSHD